jgi:replicative DNA helicase
MKQSNSNPNPRQSDIDQYLPHNFLAEKMILSCLLVNTEAIELTLRTISVDVFYFKNHQEIFKAITFMYKNNLPIDILTLITFLQDNGLLQRIGGLKVLIELLSQIPNLIILDDH